MTDDTDARRDDRHPATRPNGVEAADRIKAALGSLAFLILAPGVVAGLVPWLITDWPPPPPGRAARAGAWPHPRRPAAPAGSGPRRDPLDGGDPDRGRARRHRRSLRPL